MRTTETWLPVKGFEEYYSISNHGRCKSNPRKTAFGNNIKKYPGIILKPKHRHKLYSSYILSVGGVTKTLMIHRLVAMHFIANPDSLPQINHKDGDKQNNNASNLEWCTCKQNHKHARDNGLWVCKVREWFAADESRRKIVSERFKGDKNHMFISLSEDQKNLIIDLRKKGAGFNSIFILFKRAFPDTTFLSTQVIRRVCKDYKIQPPKIPIQKRHLHRLIS